MQVLLFVQLRFIFLKICFFTFHVFFFSVGLQPIVYYFKCTPKIWSSRLCSMAASYLQGNISNCYYDAISWHIDHPSDFGTRKHFKWLITRLAFVNPLKLPNSFLKNSFVIEICHSRAKRRSGQCHGRAFQSSAKWFLFNWENILSGCQNVAIAVLLRPFKTTCKIKGDSSGNIWSSVNLWHIYLNLLDLRLRSNSNFLYDAIVLIHIFVFHFERTVYIFAFHHINNDSWWRLVGSQT